MNATILPTDCNAALFVLRSVSDAQTDAASLTDDELVLRTLEMLADTGDGLVLSIVSDQYVREMEKRGLA